MSESIIPYDTQWAPLDVSRMAPNDDEGDRRTCRAAVLQALQRGINHLCGSSVRLVFNAAVPWASRMTNAGAGETQIFRYRVRDFQQNEFNRRFSILHQIRDSDPGSDTEAYAAPLDQTLTAVATERGPGYETEIAPLNLTPSGPDELEHYRGIAPDAEREEGLAIYNSYVPLDVQVSTQHQAAMTNVYLRCVEPPRSGADVLGGYLKHLCDTFHTMRTTHERHVLMWYAWNNGGWDTSMSANSGGSSGMRVTSNSLINLLDYSSTARNATTPGWSCHVYRCGRGDQANTTVGKQLKVTVRVLATANNNNGTVQFIGPDSFATNNVNVAVTSGAAIAWYGADSDFVYLDTSKENNDATTGRHKIDVLGAAGTNGNLYIYGLLGMAIWS